MKSALVLILIISLLFPLPLFCAMSSADYFIFADSINSGEVFTSGAYRLESTIGESPVGFATSSSYEVRGGYQAMDRSQLSMIISNTSLNLGNLDSSQINTANTTIGITTDNSSGYVLSISAVSGSAITSVSDGNVTVGDTEYGFSATGSDSLISNDVSVEVRSVAATSTVATNSQTVLTFKASISDSSIPSSYSQTITFTVANNF